MDTNLAARLWQQLWHGLRDEHTPVPQIVWQGHDAFCSVYPVSELAAASIALAAQAAAALTGNPAKPRLDAHLASRWFQHSFRPINRPLPPAQDAFAGDYQTADGWIRLHTNAPHHRQSMERVLGKQPDRAALARIVAGWQKQTLEQAIVDAGGCAAEMRSLEAWRQHPQGQSVAQEPLIARQSQAESAPPAGPAYRSPASRRAGSRFNARYCRAGGDAVSCRTGRRGAAPRSARLGRTHAGRRDDAGQTLRASRSEKRRGPPAV